MRKIAFLAIALAFAGCSKDDFNPSTPKNGQKAELFVDHYSDVRNQMVFLLPKRELSPLSLGGFKERELGYTYKVKAKVYISPQLVMDDGINSWFEYTEVISKEKYTSTEPFEIGLVHPMGWQSGGGLAVKKDNDQYLYGAGGNLRPANREVKQQLDNLILKEKELGSAEKYAEFREYLSKMAFRAVVTHDPENYGKGYVVHEIKSEN
jgi:hypothetical protein